MTFFFGLHLILRGKLDVTLSISRVWLRQPRSCKGLAAWHGLKNTAIQYCMRTLFYCTVGCMKCVVELSGVRRIFQWGFQ